MSHIDFEEIPIHVEITDETPVDYTTISLWIGVMISFVLFVRSLR